MHASIRRAAEFADAERGPIGGATSSFLSGALGFAVRTISGEIVGELVDVVPSTSTGGLEVVIVQGLLGRRRRLPAELVLGANATERVIILNLGTARALDQLGSRSTAKAPPERRQRLNHPASTHLLFLPADRGYDLVVRLAALPPASQSTIEVEGHRYSIVKIGRSPLPDDPRPCLYLLAEPRADQTSSVSTAEQSAVCRVSNKQRRPACARSRKGRRFNRGGVRGQATFASASPPTLARPGVT